VKITVSTVRQVLREALGFESFTAGFIRSIEEAEWCRTVAINNEGVLGPSPTPSYTVSTLRFSSKPILTTASQICH